MLKLDLKRIYVLKIKDRFFQAGQKKKKYKIGEYLAYCRPGAEYEEEDR